MSHIGQNIKHLRGVKKLSQAKFAELFNLARPSVGAYEEGRSEPKIQTVIEIAHYFGVSIDALLTKELTVTDLYHLDLMNQKMDGYHGGGAPQAVNIVKTNPIGLVRSSKFVEYIVNYQNRDFLNALPPIDLPLTFKGEVRAFEMYGAEMQYHDSGIHHGDLLLCRKKDFKELSELNLGSIYVIVTKERIWIRRLKAVDAHYLSIMSDDPNFSDVQIEINEDLLEVWRVKGLYSIYMDPPRMVEEKVMLLENTMKEMEERLARLESQA